MATYIIDAGGTTIREQFRQGGKCSARSGARAMIRSGRSVARRPDCSRRSTLVACAYWISVPLPTRCVGPTYPDVSAWGIVAPTLIYAVGFRR